MSCIRAALAPVEAASSGAQEKDQPVAVRDGEVVAGFNEEKLTSLLGQPDTQGNGRLPASGRPPNRLSF